MAIVLVGATRVEVAPLRHPSAWEDLRFRALKSTRESLDLGEVGVLPHWLRPRGHCRLRLTIPTIAPTQLQYQATLCLGSEVYPWHFAIRPIEVR